MTEDTEREPERLDAPNQQVVRPDQSGPADEGTGGSRHDAPKRRGRPPKSDTPAAEEGAEKGS